MTGKELVETVQSLSESVTQIETLKNTIDEMAKTIEDLSTRTEGTTNKELKEGEIDFENLGEDQLKELQSLESQLM